jgi:hypothetical protein
MALPMSIKGDFYRLCGPRGAQECKQIRHASGLTAPYTLACSTLLIPADDDIKFLALGPVSRILFHALRRFSRHFSRALSGPPVRPPRGEPRGTDGCDIPETMGRAVQSPILSCTGRGFSCRPPRGGRGGLLPHLFTLTPRFRGTPGRYILCDTVRRRGLNRAACACLAARAASCPAVSGLSSPNFYRARRYPRLGIKELGATTRPQS